LGWGDAAIYPLRPAAQSGEISEIVAKCCGESVFRNSFWRLWRAEIDCAINALAASNIGNQPPLPARY